MAMVHRFPVTDTGDMPTVALCVPLPVVAPLTTNRCGNAASLALTWIVQSPCIEINICLPPNFVSLRPNFESLDPVGECELGPLMIRQSNRHASFARLFLASFAVGMARVYERSRRHCPQ